MNMKVKAIVGSVVAAVVLVVVAMGFGIFGGPTDEQMIKTALDEAILASKEGRPGGVLELISQKFEVNDEQYGTRDIAKTIKDLKPNVEIEQPTPTITGDSATIVSPVKLAVSFPPMGTKLSQVTIRFAKENGLKWLVFPTKKWRMIKVEMPESVVEEVKGQFSGGMQL